MMKVPPVEMQEMRRRVFEETVRTHARMRAAHEYAVHDPASARKREVVGVLLARQFELCELHTELCANNPNVFCD